jgi:DNA modification methylase
MEMKIRCAHDELVPVESLKPHPKNRNKHPQAQIERLAKILAYQGWRYPVKVSNRSGFVTAGHGRIEAARINGWKAVPVSCQDYDSDEQEYADVQSDNAIASWAELDLSGIYGDILDLGEGFDVDLLGIEDFQTVDTEVIEPGCDEDEVPEVGDSRVKLGDVWRLGEHRLMCGDSTSVDAVEKLMAGAKADMVFTDPPYGVDYQGGHNAKKRAGIKGDKLEGQNLTDLFRDSLALACAFSHEHAAFYIWYANGKAVETFASFGTLPLKVRAVICWYKVRSGLGAFMSQYIPNYEPCIYAFKEGCSPQWFGPTDEKTVWELKRDSRNEYHPTQKPVELPERAINNSSEKFNIIMDLFGGSGSTLIACEKLNRKARLMELDPKYCGVILARWEKYTNKLAERIDG